MFNPHTTPEGWNGVCLIQTLPYTDQLGWILYEEIFDDTMETKLSYNFTLENITFPGEEGGEYLIYNIAQCKVLFVILIQF